MAPYVSLSEQRRLLIALPPLQEQRAIAEVLGALDDRIDVNSLMLRSLVAVARKHWRKCSGDCPSVPLGDIAQIGLSGVWGEDHESENATVETFCLRGRDLEDLVERRPPSAPRRWVSKKQIENRTGNAPEIWTAGSGSLGPTLLVTEKLRAAFALPLTNSNFVKRLISRPGREAALPSAWFSLLDAWDAGDFAVCTTGTAMPNLDAKALLQVTVVPVPARAELDTIARWAELALDPTLLNENRCLGELRDVLLPKLVSGELRVGDVKSLVEEAV